MHVLQSCCSILETRIISWGSRENMLISYTLIFVSFSFEFFLMLETRILYQTSHTYFSESLYCSSVSNLQKTIKSKKWNRFYIKYAFCTMPNISSSKVFTKSKYQPFQTTLISDICISCIVLMYEELIANVSYFFKVKSLIKWDWRQIYFCMWTVYSQIKLCFNVSLMFL